MTKNHNNSQQSLHFTDKPRLLKDEVLSILASRLGCSVENLTFLFGASNPIDGIKIPDYRN